MTNPELVTRKMYIQIKKLIYQYQNTLGEGDFGKLSDKDIDDIMELITAQIRFQMQTGRQCGTNFISTLVESGLRYGDQPIRETLSDYIEGDLDFLTLSKTCSKILRGNQFLKKLSETENYDIREMVMNNSFPAVTIMHDRDNFIIYVFKGINDAQLVFDSDKQIDDEYKGELISMGKYRELAAEIDKQHRTSKN